MSRGTALLGFTAVIATGLLLLGRRWPRRGDALMRRWYAGACRLCGLVVEVDGAAADARPMLYVSNHVSYLDIPVLGAHLRSRFVAKSEVSGWPFIGHMARLAGTHFVQRHASRAGEQVDSLSRRLDDGEALTLFPEGTSTDGAQVLRFRSSLFQSVFAADDGRGLTVQPITLSYERRDAPGLPEPEFRDRYAWYTDEGLVPHLGRLLGWPGAVVRVRLHAPLSSRELGDRKRLASTCEELVREGLRAP